MSKLESLDPDFESRVRASFDRRGAIVSIGAKLVSLIPGEARIEMPFNASADQLDDKAASISVARKTHGPAPVTATRTPSSVSATMTPTIAYRDAGFANFT